MATLGGYVPLKLKPEYAMLPTDLSQTVAELLSEMEMPGDELMVWGDAVGHARRWRRGEERAFFTSWMQALYAKAFIAYMSESASERCTVLEEMPSWRRTVIG